MGDNLLQLMPASRLATLTADSGSLRAGTSIGSRVYGPETEPMMQFILAIGFIAIGFILFAVSFDVPLPEWLPVLPALFGE